MRVGWRSRFEIFGNDQWLKDDVDCYVRSTHPEHVPGTIDQQRWVEDLAWTGIGTFPRAVKMRTDTVPGSMFRRLTLVVDCPDPGRSRRRRTCGGALMPPIP